MSESLDYYVLLSAAKVENIFDTTKFLGRKIVISAKKRRFPRREISLTAYCQSRIKL